MSEILTLDKLMAAVSGNAAAFRCRRRLQPAGGEGDKVFPPTYSGAVYAVEQRRVKDEAGQWNTATCVLLDSVQSQANRMEEALQEAIDSGDISMPLVSVDFSDIDLPESVGRVSTFQAPHRIADAILRDSEYEKKPFRASSIGKEIDRVSLAYATPLLRLCPQALVFGLWDSTGPKGGLGTKFERAIVSEVIGVDAEVGIRSASRVDPIVRKTESIVLYKKGDFYTLNEDEADKDSNNNPIKYGNKSKAGKVSAANLGNVTPSVIDNDTKKPLLGGISVNYAEQTTTLSLIALRRLRFPESENGTAAQEANIAARTLLAALSLCSATVAFGPGMDLRSRCLLFPEEPMTWELLDKPGEPPQAFSLERESAIELFNAAIAAATKANLPWDVEPIVLTPSKQLVQLVRKSQELAVGESDES